MGKRKVLRINARHQRRPRSFRKGDCLIFDIRILHGSAPNASPQEAQSRYTLRMASEDARIHYHGDWARAERCVFEEFRHREGDDINSEFFPALCSFQHCGRLRNKYSLPPRASVWFGSQTFAEHRAAQHKRSFLACNSFGYKPKLRLPSNPFGAEARLFPRRNPDVLPRRAC
jgi:hypothetical protein